MSIVERALSKLQGSRQQTPAAPAPRQRALAVEPARNSPVPSVAGTLPAPAGGAIMPLLWPVTSGKRCAIDKERLRTQGLLPPEDSVRQVMNEFRRIKWPLLAGAIGEGAQLPRGNLIMVASSVAGEGKTFTTFNLARSLALEKDCAVLVIDADLAKPKLTHLLGLSRESGLTELLSDDTVTLAQSIISTDIDNLAVIPAGKPSPTAPELLASKRMDQIAEQLLITEPKLVVLFDSSPLLLTNEAQVLSRVVGQVLMVVRAEHTTQPHVVEALSRMEPGAKVSCVLNQAARGGTADYYYDYTPYGVDPPKEA